ncbi:sporulation histidine kinase inhibitor Sda [Priestia megaterium]|uniref:Sporulation histidine kinase inhibitor Sda n=1 Tax=Priestia megaterium TaxID=1404 RepID=A0A6H1P1R6_PRIMG|nr:sporulation histidine kinase inhibitor Sda [Priestia megaterium]QIZ07530.1 sporulation histidine kinase inhibitor Sda [Priestia megaterium]
MKKLSIAQLLETLNKAIELNLQQDFIDLIVYELDRKQFKINIKS